MRIIDGPRVVRSEEDVRNQRITYEVTFTVAVGLNERGVNLDDVCLKATTILMGDTRRNPFPILGGPQ